MITLAMLQNVFALYTFPVPWSIVLMTDGSVIAERTFTTKHWFDKFREPRILAYVSRRLHRPP